MKVMALISGNSNDNENNNQNAVNNTISKANIRILSFQSLHKSLPHISKRLMTLDESHRQENVWMRF